MNPEQTLTELFDMIGLKEAVEQAMFNECRNAYLHGLADSAFESKDFNLADYRKAKEAIANLGNDRFTDDYERKFGKKLIENSHLGEWDDELAD